MAQAPKLSPKIFWEKARQEGLSIIDVRSPAEFAHGHIPKSINIPLLNNEERAIVGTLYKQKGREEAVIAALDFVGPRISQYIKQTAHLKGPLLITCWRGGMRSMSVAWSFSLINRPVFVLEGGYKAFRNHVLSTLETLHFPQMIILGGATGSGKTQLLQSLKEGGHTQVLDLEALAHHKGSAFGGLGEKDFPTQEQFENNLFSELVSLEQDRPLWVEDESQRIGSCLIPKGFYAQMRHASVVKIERTLTQRLQQLSKDYANFSQEELAFCITKIGKRLGGQNVKMALEALKENRFDDAVGIVLTYYDRAYEFGLSKRESPQVLALPLNEDDHQVNTQKLLELENHYRR